MPSLKPDCACALQRKAGTVTAFAAEQSVLCGPICSGIIAKHGQLCVFRRQKSRLSLLLRLRGGGRGIRTPGTVSRTVVFKTTALSLSAIPPHLVFNSLR